MGSAKAADPLRRTWPFDSLGNLLVAPGARFDSGWYLAIAHNGYFEPPRRAFLPLYPLLMRVVGVVTGSQLIAGLIVSCAAFLVALYLLHRLVELDFGRRIADRTLALVAFFPTALFFSAVYTESLFLALSLGCLLNARRGRLIAAGACGALAAATRPPGVLIVVPLVVMLIYGPRARLANLLKPDRWRPRLALRPSEYLAVLAVLAGLAACAVYFALAHGDGLAPLHQNQTVWHVYFAGPVIGAWDAAHAGAVAAGQLLRGANLPYPNETARYIVQDSGFFVFALVAVLGALRRLPLAYSAYALVGVLLPLSYPVDGEPLQSFPRYIVVLFPLFIWLALWTDRGRRYPLVLAGSAALEATAVGLFAEGQWVA
jgi:hypothetical protein